MYIHFFLYLVCISINCDGALSFSLPMRASIRPVCASAAHYSRPFQITAQSRPFFICDSSGSNYQYKKKEWFNRDELPEHFRDNFEPRTLREKLFSNNRCIHSYQKAFEEKGTNPPSAVFNVFNDQTDS